MATKKEDKKTESKYSRAEIMGAAASFGVRSETMAGALRLVNKQELTKGEVKEAIKRFKGRKVN